MRDRSLSLENPLLVVGNGRALMNDDIETSDALKRQRVRLLLLILALLTSPALCCGGLQLLDALPSAGLPSSLDAVVNIFESAARVENKTSYTFYITAVTTTSGVPRVIPQYNAFRQRDLPLQPGSSITLQYDAADLPLSAIIVCRDTQDCRRIPATHLDLYVLSSYESLEKLDPGWLESIQSSPLHNYSFPITGAIGLASSFFFIFWFYLQRREKTPVTGKENSLT